MRTLGQPNGAWAGDSGAPDPAVRAALASVDGASGYLAAVATLCGARLLVPVVATGNESDLSAGESRHADLAAVLTTSAGGARGVLAFTGLDALQAFDPKARPVLCTLDQVAATAQEAGAAAVVIDIAGPSALVLENPLLRELADGRRLVRIREGWGWLSVREDRELPERATAG